MTKNILRSARALRQRWTFGRWVWLVPILLGSQQPLFSQSVTVPSYSQATLPASNATTQGNLAHLTDGSRSLQVDTGTQWVSHARGILNVKEFGAKGDGVNDDRSAIQTAVDVAGSLKATVFFPPGTYLVGQYQTQALALNLPSSVQLIGAGRECSIIKLAVTPTNSWVRVISATNASNITIRDLSIDGSYASNTSGTEQMSGIFLNGCSNVLLTNLALEQTRGDGVLLYGGCKRITISGCIFDGNHRDGIALTGNQSIVVNGNIFKNTASTAIDNEPDTGGNSNIVILSNLIEPSVLHGISIGANQVDSLTQITVRGNIVNGGIDIVRAASVDVTGNVVTGTPNLSALVISHKDSNIRVFNNQIYSGSSSLPAVSMFAAAPSGTLEIPQNVIFTSNVVKTSGGNGLEIRGLSNLVIYGNIITGAGLGYGVLLYATVPQMNEVVVSGNTIKNFSKGIFATASGTSRINGLLINNNLFNDDQSTPTQTAGIEFVSTLQFIDNAAISGNSTSTSTMTPLATNVSQSYLVSGNAKSQSIQSGNATPETTMVSPVGSLYLRRDGSTGTSMYVKESGTGSTGWMGK